MYITSYLPQAQIGKKVEIIMQELQILYASATGTAEDVAYYLAKRLRRLKLFTVRVSSIDDYDFLARLPEQKYILFVVSTTGDGDPPSSMRSTEKALILIKFLINANLFRRIQQASGCFFYVNPC